jgi:hypothetical protein
MSTLNTLNNPVPDSLRVHLAKANQVVTVANRSQLAMARGYLDDNQLAALSALNSEYIAKVKEIEDILVTHDQVIYKGFEIEPSDVKVEEV